MLAFYTDCILRKGGIKLPENEQEEHLRKIVHLFTHFTDKDFFIEVFRSYLGKRLLNDKSSGLDLEKMIISHIKMSIGHYHTKKLEGMLIDLNLAADENKKFH